MVQIRRRLIAALSVDDPLADYVAAPKEMVAKTLRPLNATIELPNRVVLLTVRVVGGTGAKVGVVRDVLQAITGAVVGPLAASSFAAILV
jgi:hypothetical protein